MIDWNKELDKVDEATRPIAEGEHTFKIIDATATVSSTGNRMIRTTVKGLYGDAVAAALRIQYGGKRLVLNGSPRVRHGKLIQ